MKVAFYGPANDFTEALLDGLRANSDDDTIVAWRPKQPAPAEDFEVMVALGPVSREVMAGQGKLALIQTASDGYETVDIHAASEQGVWVSFSPGGPSGNADSVAEYAVALLIAACRRMGEERAFVRDHAKPRPLLNKGLVGKTVCIVGFGDIGSKVAERLRPFGVKLTAVDKHTEHLPGDVQGFRDTELKAALGEADAFILCVRASAETKGMIDAEALAAAKHGAVLVNIARGSLVDEDALLQALRSGQIGAAGLDVVAEEPVDPKNPLLALPQVFLTPHIAGFTDLTLKGTTKVLTENLNAFRSGKKISSLLNEPPQPRRPLR